MNKMKGSGSRVSLLPETGSSKNVLIAPTGTIVVEQPNLSVLGNTSHMPRMDGRLRDQPPASL